MTNKTKLLECAIPDNRFHVKKGKELTHWENFDLVDLNSRTDLNIWHIFDNQQAIDAVNAALVINRPLLVMGEPGIGKSQLAKAVAKKLDRVFLSFTVDAHTESRDLLWEFDAVARLAEAQIYKAAKDDNGKGATKDTEDDNGKGATKDTDTLKVSNFIKPKVLWWALSWEKAKELTEKNKLTPPDVGGRKPADGIVVLIDEIDKAAGSVPNGLLEVLDTKQFDPPGEERVEADNKKPYPLIIITCHHKSNLPDAFLRRCLILHLNFPDTESEKINFLIRKASKTFKDKCKSEKFTFTLNEDNDTHLLRHAAKMLVADREEAEKKGLYPLCGLSEYYDLLLSIVELNDQTKVPPKDLMESLRRYTYKKQFKKD